MDNYLTVDETAKALKVEPNTVRKWLREGTIKGIKLGKSWRIAEAALRNQLSKMTTDSSVATS
jgi:excisionase family DNA binding protein